MRAPIYSIKHYVQVSLTTVLAGATNPILLARGLERSLVNTATEVAEGSIVKAVYVEMWCRAGSTVQGNVLVTLVKTNDLQTPAFADMTNLFAYNQKKNIFYHTQGLTNQDTADAIPFVRGWFKIPKSKQRFGLGDSLFIVVTAQAQDVEHCGFAVYKEYS